MKGKELTNFTFYFTKQNQKPNAIDRQANTSTGTNTDTRQKATGTPKPNTKKKRTQHVKKLDVARQHKPYPTLQQRTPPFLGPLRKRRASLYPLRLNMSPDDPRHAKTRNGKANCDCDQMDEHRFASCGRYHDYLDEKRCAYVVHFKYHFQTLNL